MSSRWNLKNFRRHYCNGCKRIFDCDPCPHAGAGPVRLVFCSAACEANHKSVEVAQPTADTMFERYLKRAGLGRKRR